MVADGSGWQLPVVDAGQLRQRALRVEASGLVAGHDVDAVVVDPELVALGGQRGIDALVRDLVGDEPVAEVCEPRAR